MGLNQSIQASPQRWVLAAIGLYQRTLSPDHGPLQGLFPGGVCRFEPTCSQYAQHAISQLGWRGVGLAALRILRCHPFAPGGFDPVPSRKL